MSGPSSVAVLCVDDDPAFVDLAADYLERTDEQLAVHTATGAESAMATIRADGIDCVVSDYEMPETDGLEFLRRLRDVRPDLPFILYTGKGSEEIASEAIGAGVTGYLQKGTGTDQYAILANRIRQAVDSAETRRQLERREREYRTLVEAAPVPMVVIDREIDFLFANDSAGDITNVADGAALTGRSAIEFIHPEDRETALERATQVFEAREPVPAREYRILDVDGGVHDVRGTIVPVTFEGESAALVVLVEREPMGSEAVE